MVFNAQLGREASTFDIDTVLDEIANKLIRRHPHVFGEWVVEGWGVVRRNWEAITRAQREAAGAGGTDG